MFGTVTALLPATSATDILTAVSGQVVADGPVLIGILGAAIGVGFVWTALKKFSKKIHA